MPGLSKKAKKALVEGTNRYNDPNALPRGTSYMQRLADYVFAKTGERYSVKQCDTALTTLSMSASTTFQRRAPGSGRGLTARAKELLIHGNQHRNLLDTTNGLIKGLIAYIAANTNPSETYTHNQVERVLRRETVPAATTVEDSEAGPSAAGPGSPYEVNTREGDEAVSMRSLRFLLSTLRLSSFSDSKSPQQHVLHHHGMMFSGQDHVLVPNNEVHYDERRHLYLDSQGQTVTPHWIDDEFF
ncbi:hypothetical protein JCM8547_004342 [Rhodosporidiobolus lusitaniae]